MSRVGKNPVQIPSGVTAAIAGGELKVKGKLGELSLRLSDEIEAKLENDSLAVSPRTDSKQARAMWGTTRALVNNMVKGVSQGFVRRLEINGVGYRAAIQGKEVVLNLGYSHDVKFEIPTGVTIVAEKPTLLVISGADRQKVGQVAAKIRAFRGPEPYKGKGIKYEEETLIRKEGKKK